VRCGIGSEGFVGTSVRGVNDGECAVEGRARERGLERTWRGRRRDWEGLTGFEGGADGWRPVGDSNCAVKTCDVVFLGEKGNCYFSGHAIRSGCWNGDSLDGGRCSTETWVFPTGERNYF